jgi:multidrug efflux pump subunit AcrA (membrane-fusion protein)
MSALVRNGEGAVIYRVNSTHKVEAVPVNMGLMQADGIVISAAEELSLNAGEEIVVAGSHRLFDGANVEVLP